MTVIQTAQQAAAIALLRERVFPESLEGFAAAAAAASLIVDWEGAEVVGAAAKQQDIDDTIALLREWRETL